MIDKLWQLKKPTGAVKKRGFPYMSHFWEVDKTKTGYYLGITADDYVRPTDVSLLCKNIAAYFEPIRLSDLAIHIGKKYKDQPVDTTNLSTSLEALTESYASPWYGDDVCIGFTVEGAHVLIEPESDGEELGVFISGDKANKIYSHFKTWLNL